LGGLGTVPVPASENLEEGLTKETTHNFSKVVDGQKQIDWFWWTEERPRNLGDKIQPLVDGREGGGGNSVSNFWKRVFSVSERDKPENGNAQPVTIRKQTKPVHPEKHGEGVLSKTDEERREKGNRGRKPGSWGGCWKVFREGHEVLPNLKRKEKIERLLHPKPKTSTTGECGVINWTLGRDVGKEEMGFMKRSLQTGASKD